MLKKPKLADICVCCGNDVSEGRQICPICEDELKTYRAIKVNDNGSFIYTSDKVQVHLMICSTLNDIYTRKNHDYGDSFAKLRKELPNAILVRIYDKYSRLKTLMEGAEQKVKDESIDDTLMDLANYCIMELVERKMSNEC